MKYMVLLLLLLSVTVLHFALYMGRILNPVEWTRIESAEKPQKETVEVNENWETTTVEEEISTRGSLKGEGWAEGRTQKIGIIPGSKSSTDFVYNVQMDSYTIVLLVSLLFHSTAIITLWRKVQPVAGGDATR